MSSLVRRSVAAAGTVVAASSVTFALMLGGAGAAHADPGPGGDGGGQWCSGSSACVKTPKEFNKEAMKCIPPAVVGGALGAPGGPGTAAGGFAAGGAMCAYNKAVN